MAELSDGLITMRAPDDFHLHLRQGAPMADYAALIQSAGFARALVMPNTVPPVTDREGLERYRREIVQSATDLTPLMTFKLIPGMTAARVADLAAAGAVAGKYYPAGATTNSSDGLTRWELCGDAMAEMEKRGLVFSIHGEDPLAPALEREQAFLPQFREMVHAFPRLKVVFEHISSREGVRMVLDMPDRVAATVTAHHLLLTQEDILGGGLNPHLFCRPLPKTADDRDALRDLVFNGPDKIFFGSDSAPHSRSHKECASAAAGIFTSPVALPALVELFESAGRLERLEPFLSERGADFYGLEKNRGAISFVKESWTVPEIYDNVVPMLAGKELSWRLR